MCLTLSPVHIVDFFHDIKVVVAGNGQKELQRENHPHLHWTQTQRPTGGHIRVQGLVQERT